jgi:reactive intermediate/imine deaminase
MRRSFAIAMPMLCAATLLPAQDRQVINLPTAVTAPLPFSSAIRTGNLLFLSGQIGTTAQGLVAGGIRAEVRQTMENIRTVLEASGSSLSRVVKCTVFLADIADYAAMNEVYRSFFPEGPPARSTVAVSGLALGARTEIECIAAVG